MPRIERPWSRPEPDWEAKPKKSNAPEWEPSTPLSVEQQEALLTPEYLAGLSLNEYMALWRRLNPYFLSHVTRQGVLDHGWDFFAKYNSFTFRLNFDKILQSGNMLRTRFHRDGLVDRSEKSVRAWLGDALQEPTEEKARKSFTHKLSTLTEDETHLHVTYISNSFIEFSAQKVLDEYAGGERGNEIFFLFPADVILSQYQFSQYRDRGDVVTLPRYDDANAVYVWPKTQENDGIPLNSGIVFLPKSVQVDPATGSRYASDATGYDDLEGFERGIYTVDSRVNTFIGQMHSTPEVAETVRKLQDAWNEHRGRDADELVQSLRDQMPGILLWLGYEYDIAEQIVDLFCRKLSRQENPMDQKAVKYILTYSGALFLRPEETVSAYEYWERRFAEHPEQRPKRIVYYDGSPNEAVQDFLQQNGITDENFEPETKLLGHDKRFLGDFFKHPSTIHGLSELLTMISQILKEHYYSE